MPTTIKDIAARLNISHATVSRALSDFPYVSDDLRRRVRETAVELNYRPNALARGLKGSRSSVVGLIIPDLLNDFYASAATVIQATLAAEGYRLLLCVSNNDPQSEVAYLRALREERVEGLIWVPRRRNDRALREFADEGVPVVEFARRESPRVDAVVADDLGGAYAATTYLLELGHSQIGLIVGQAELSTGRERLEGYQRALRDAGVEADDRYVRIGRFDRAWGRRATAELLDLPDPPTALFATSSELVVGVLKALDERGLCPPHDISLVGFGDPEWFAIWRPPITTVAFPTADLAHAVAHALLRKIKARAKAADGDESPSRPVRFRLDCHLVIRQSTVALSNSATRVHD